MSATRIVDGLYLLSNSGINAYLVDEGDDGVTLIDTGYPNQQKKFENDIHSIGRELTDITRIVLTHCHPDHLGNARAFSGDTAPIAIHPLDAGVARVGHIEQTMTAGPGLLNKILFKLAVPQEAADFPSFEPDVALADGELLDIAGGIEVIHTPGHTAGHVSLLWKKDRGVLIAGDAAANAVRLGFMLGYDDVETGKASLARLASREFEVAVFGHGRPILEGASKRFSRFR